MNTVIIDDREFEFECSVFPLGAENALLLTKSAVKSLKIQESIFTGWMTGVITIDNQSRISDGLNPAKVPRSSVLYLKIRDLSTNSLCSDSKNEGDFYIENFFSITNSTSDETNSLITCEFEDYTYSMIKNFTSRDIKQRVKKTREKSRQGHGSRNTKSDNFGRCGDIIKKLLLQRLEYKEEDRDQKASVRGKLLKPWDRGKYPYTQQPVQNNDKIFNTIERVMKSYVPDVEGIGDNNEDVFDLSIFYADRDGNISFTPLSKLLEESNKKPEEYILELAFIGGEVGASDASNNKKITTDGNSLGELSIITGSEFNEGSNDENYTKKFNKAMNKFTSSVQSSSSCVYDELLPDFVRRLENYHFKKFVKIFGEKEPVVSSIVYPMLTVEGETPIPSDHDYSNNPEIGRNVYGSEIMTNLVLNGYTCKITMRGSLHRTHGKIIEIATTNSNPITDDYKKLGKWFVKTVLHEFADDKYHNTLECCKTYATDPDPS